MSNVRKKVGIMTWYTYRNYGSALQASALFHKIHSLGYDPYMIQYIPKGRIVVQQSRGDYWRTVLRKIPKKLLSRNERVVVSAEQEALYSAYVDEKLKQTQLCENYLDLFSLNTSMDAFVCGSDQIWAPSCFEDKYFLSFVKDHHKKVAYAPSIGLGKVANQDIRLHMSSLIEKFSHLSVREKQGAAIIEKLTGKKAQVVSDPTLLMNAEEWDQFVDCSSVSRIAGDYAICYFLGDSKAYSEYVQRLSAKLQLPVYVIPVTSEQRKQSNVVPFEVGPKEFVNLIRNAKYTFTDSFHGMVFSINYQVPFVVFKRFKSRDPINQNSRIINMLEVAGMQERLVDYDDKHIPDELLRCDYENAQARVDALREESLAYLRDALYAATEQTAERTKRKIEKITDLCCGCSACAAICPKQAISIVLSKEGFYESSIDAEKCVGCGLCETVCPYHTAAGSSLRQAIGLYAVKSNSEDVLKKSSSGGVAYELASSAIAQNSWVCGCIYDTHKQKACHVMVEPGNLEGLTALQGSKYIQSDTTEAMRQIAAMEKGEKLMFFGTPCQVAAVDKLLIKQGKREDAILVDLICHGVPTRHLWKNYLKEINEKYRVGLTPEVDFRNKEKGWRNRTISITGDGQRYECNEKDDDFYAFFRRGICDMKSCFECAYRQKSAADIRIGDYWGPKFLNDQTGVSMAIANTERGEAYLQHLSKTHKCALTAYDLSEYWSVQYPENPIVPVYRERLLEELRKGEKSVSQLRKEYCASYDAHEFVNVIKKHIKTLLRKG